MLAIVMLIACVVAGAAWLIVRRSIRTPAQGSPVDLPVIDASAPAGSTAGSSVDGAQVDAAANGAAARLWKLAFSGPSQGQVSQLIDGRVRDNVLAMLQVDTLDEKYFPRRPTLLPQLLQAVNDPRSASDKISRIIAHDPVLTAEVLRLANSSLHRTSPAPIETIQRAIVVCGVDALRGMLAAAMLQPVFRATRKNFPRLPRMLWERTERAARAAEAYALAVAPHDRFEAQMVVLLSALGPLVVYSAVLDVYARNPHFSPNGELCVALIVDLAPLVSRHIAREWQTSPRLVAALGGSADEPLTRALQVGELLGTLSFLESQTVITRAERCEAVSSAGLGEELMERIFP
jgi:HD-like signal output (HDOD) protein